ncbi:MAG: 50S ribosomal protein L11 methyltransferase [Solirubrobacterales bacterium]
MIRLAIRCRAENAELALAQLIELAPTGIEELHDGDIVEYAVYGPPGEVPSLPDLEVAVGDELVEVRTTEVPDDWHERWKQFHGAVLVSGDRGDIDLRPSWDQGAARRGATAIVLDPGQAFGTGSHPTTRLCLRLLLGLEPDGEAVDLGCGSGVLAIAASKLGWNPVRGYDHDPLAVEAAAANARENAVELAVGRFDLRDQPPPLAPTVLANLMRPLLLEIAARVPAGHAMRNMILSGLLDEEADEVAAAFARLGLRERERISEGGWTGLLLSR